MHVDLAAFVFGIVEPHDLDNIAQDAVVAAVGAVGLAGHVAAGDGQQEVGQTAAGLEPEVRLLQFSANGAAECLAKTGLQGRRSVPRAWRLLCESTGQSVEMIGCAEALRHSYRSSERATGPRNSQDPGTGFCQTASRGTRSRVFLTSTVGPAFG